MPPSYSDLEGRFYDELEASAEEAVRDALYGECLITCFVEWLRRQAHAPPAHAARLVLRLVNNAHACCAWYDWYPLCWQHVGHADRVPAYNCLPSPLAEARSVVVTQPNNKLSRVLKTMLKELPAQMRAINAAGLVSSLAMSDMVAAVAGPTAADAAREQLQRRLQMIRSLQVR